MDLIRIQGGIENFDSNRILLGQPQVPFPHPKMKLLNLTLEPILPLRRGAGKDSPLRSVQPNLYRAVEEEGEIGPDPLGGDEVQPVNEVQVLASPVPLVCGGGVGEAITDNPPAGRQGRLDHLSHMLSPVGSVEQELRKALHFAVVAVEEHAANVAPKPGAAGLPGDDMGDTALLQEPGQAFHLGCLPAPLDALQGDEHGRYRSSPPGTEGVWSSRL